MFVGNTTLIRTVNDTLSSSSSKRLSTFCPIINSQENQEYLTYTPITDESNHYDEIDLEEKNEKVI
jgi:hypothetical protein